MSQTNSIDEKQAALAAFSYWNFQVVGKVFDNFYSDDCLSGARWKVENWIAVDANLKKPLLVITQFHCLKGARRKWKNTSVINNFTIPIDARLTSILILRIYVAITIQTIGHFVIFLSVNNQCEYGELNRKFRECRDQWANMFILDSRFVRQALINQNYVC